MEIHKPKPAHTVREFLSEVAVVVLGIVIALAGEQFVQTLEWHHKTKLADEQMRQEIAGDDGPQVLEQLAISPCVETSLNAIRADVEQNSPRATLVQAIDQFWTPQHTWDSVAFQAANASGVLAQVSPERISLLSYFYVYMPVIEAANEREYHDGAALLAVSRTGAALTESEREQVLSAVETLRRDNADLTRLATIANDAMRLLGISVKDAARPMVLSQLRDPERVVLALRKVPMAQPCVGQLSQWLAAK